MARHLSLQERITIENNLYQKATLTEIARTLSRDVSTIRKEIILHRKESFKTNPYRSYNSCVHRSKCPYRGYCERCPSKVKRCNGCKKCNDYCSHYEEEICEKKDKKPYCCNGCSLCNLSCTLRKYIYTASVAQAEYETTLSKSREGYNITNDELEYLSVTLEDLVKNKGQSVNAAYQNNSDLFNVCPKTIYNYIDAGILSTRNIDLARKIRFAPRKAKKQHKVDRKCTEGRTYQDFLDLLQKNPGIDVVEMDTVEGKKGQSVLLTIYFRSCSVQLGRLRIRNNARSVREAIDKIYLKVGHDMFTKLFPVILLDNGTEFSDPESIENYITVDEETGELIKIKRTRVFYCNAYSPYQKGSCERNHEFIRYFVPKGHSFSEFTQSDIDLMMNHINSYPRGEKKNLMVPTQRFLAIYGNDTAKQLGIELIEANQVTLNKSIFNKK